MGPAGKNGKNGKDGKQGPPGEKGADGKDASELTEEFIVKKINKLKEKIEWGTLKNVPYDVIHGSGGKKGGGGTTIKVQATAPTNPTINDLWFDIS